MWCILLTTGHVGYRLVHLDTREEYNVSHVAELEDYCFIEWMGSVWVDGNGWMGEWVFGWVDGRADGRMDGWVGVWMVGWMDCLLMQANVA